MFKKNIIAYALGIAGVLTLFLLGSYNQPRSNVSWNTKQTVQEVRPVEIPSYLDLAGEPMPLENFDVRERLDRELLNNAFRYAVTLSNMKRMRRYFAVIEPILARNGVPDDFKYLAITESDLREATSPAGAKGIWQFMKQPAEYYKLVINEEVDERNHLEKSTEAACKFLIDAKRRMGSWTLAAASYNIGEPKLRGYLQAQKVSNFYDLQLNDETSRYVFRIAAIKQIYSNPEKYGYYLNDTDYYSSFGEVYSIEVTSSVADLAAFAQQYGSTYRVLKLYNPWLLKPSLTNSERRKYYIQLPKK